MKNLKLLLGLIIFSACNSIQIHTTDLEKLKLHGSIKRIEKYAFEVKLNFGELEKVRPISQITIEPFYDDFFRELYFDKNGNIIRKIYIDSSNTQTGEEIFKYDNHNRLIEDVIYPEFKRLIEYDDKNLKSIENVNYSGKLPYHNFVYNYYDTKGNAIKNEIYSDNKLVERVIFEYDNTGKKISEMLYGSLENGQLSSIKYFKYDEKMNLISIYDSVVNSRFLKSRLELYKFNQNNDIEEIDEPNEPYFAISRPTYSYKYDTHGNWIERVGYIGEGEIKRPDVLTIRKIEYY